MSDKPEWVDAPRREYQCIVPIVASLWEDPEQRKAVQTISRQVAERQAERQGAYLYPGEGLPLADNVMRWENTHDGILGRVLAWWRPNRYKRVVFDQVVRGIRFTGREV